ncbi:protein of unknown function [Maridesulfovibrio hydrothermalis AM13 = DSM 14728]|uniref:Uncharacterized protein n=1 Tax=Maridesulfovibrio hydrothermalis AM13 = DSM 14728 TaxID=1121451 RepID=L0RBQ0_9BACT|nr:protein of unknown function [Maridesulfovibrio hydrothermalis AM13 = DSM 14728]
MFFLILMLDLYIDIIEQVYASTKGNVLNML